MFITTFIVSQISNLRLRLIESTMGWDKILKLRNSQSASHCTLGEKAKPVSNSGLAKVRTKFSFEGRLEPV